MLSPCTTTMDPATRQASQRHESRNTPATTTLGRQQKHGIRMDFMRGCLSSSEACVPREAQTQVDTGRQFGNQGPSEAVWDEGRSETVAVLDPDFSTRWVCF